MSDQKISELTEHTTPVATDVYAVVTSGTTKKIQHSNLGFMNSAGIFGGIHVHDASAGAQSIPDGVTYTKLTCYTHDSGSSNVTPDAANDKITLTIAGYYLVNCSLNFSAGNNKTINIALFSGGAEEDSIHIVRKIGTAGDVGSASFSGILYVPTVPVDLDVRARHDDIAPVDITVIYSNLSVLYAGTG